MKQDIYSIGEFSQLLGVTPDTLRYYEKRGVLSPKRDSENQYRYYSADDCPRMTAFRLFRACGFSFESTQASEACVNHPNFSKTIHSSVHDIQTEITLLKAKKKHYWNMLPFLIKYALLVNLWKSLKWIPHCISKSNLLTRLPF